MHMVGAVRKWTWRWPAAPVGGLPPEKKRRPAHCQLVAAEAPVGVGAAPADGAFFKTEKARAVLAPAARRRRQAGLARRRRAAATEHKADTCSRRSRLLL